jgi:putative ABC transport system permease protein
MTGPSERVLDISVFGLRASGALRIYRVRLRRHAMQELLAGVGIAIGIALVFGVLLANTSVLSSAKQVIDGVIGDARLQLAARSPEGFSESLARRAAEVPGVARAALLLRRDVVIEGPSGSESVQLVGVTPQLIGLRSIATQSFSGGALLSSGGIGLPLALAQALGVHAGASVKLSIDGTASRVPVSAELGSQAIGPVAQSPLAVMLLPYAQRVAGERGRVSQVLIEPRAGQEALARRQLQTLAAGRLDVLPAGHELQVLASAAQPLQQSSTLFAAIGAMVGFLLALNAMLITMPERRRNVAELVLQGFDRRQLMLLLGGQAALLGCCASLVGIGLGYLLARTLFYQPPVYLSTAFPVFAHQTVAPWMVLAALAAGVLAALACALPPIHALRTSATPTADAVLHDTGEPGQRIPADLTRILAGVSLSLIVGASLLAALTPSLTVLAGVMLALAVPCAMPALFMLMLALLTRLSRSLSGSMLAVAAMELRCTATRSVALIGVTALALYGSVAIGATRQDLTRGLDAAVTEYLGTADIWVAQSDNFLTVDPFPAGAARAAIAKLPSVSSVRVYQGALLDVGNRRLWIRARPPGDGRILQASQLISGKLARASALIRGSDWAAVSNVFATERSLRVGSAFTLPTPQGTATFRVAAITTNTGWAPGAITIGTTDYRRWWGTTEASALEVNLRAGVAPGAGQRAVQRALGPHSGLMVQTRMQRERVFDATAREGLRSLGDISTLLLLAAALSVASALGASIWQRRERLATMKTQGFDSLQLLRSLLLESLIAVSVGCVGGAAVGLYGHVLADRWLTSTTGFPAPFVIGHRQLLLALSVVVAITLLMIAWPGWSAARVSPSMGSQD